MLGEGEDTGDVIIVGRLFFFGEVANDVCAGGILLGLRTSE